VSTRELEYAAVRFLEGWGFSAEFIEEAGKPTPDIRATDTDGALYLLEIKQRTVAWNEHAERVWSSTLGIEVMKRVDPGGPSNTVDGVIGKAVDQLESVAAGDKGVLRLVWIIADPTDREFHYDRVRQTVYGTRVVVATGNIDSAVREGIYVAPSAFVRWRNAIDGVLLGAFDCLLLNDLSPRYENLKRSRIAQLCGAGLFDPPEIAASAHCYYLPPDGSRLTSQSVKARLEAIYGVHVIELIDLHRYSAATSVSVEAPVAVLSSPVKTTSYGGAEDAVCHWLENTNPGCSVSRGTPITFTLTCPSKATVYMVKVLALAFVDYARVREAEEALYRATSEEGLGGGYVVLVAGRHGVISFIKSVVDDNPPRIPSIGIIAGFLDANATFHEAYRWEGLQ